MKRNLKVIACVLLAVAGLASCAHFNYNNNRYSTRAEAVAAAKADIAATLAGVVPTKDRAGGSAAIVVPTRFVIEQDGVRRGRFADPEAVGYVADVLELAFTGQADVVAHGQVFDRTEPFRALDTASFDAHAFDFKLFLVSDASGKWQWLLSTGAGNQRIPIAADATLKGSARANSFNAAVARAAMDLRRQ